MNRLAIWVAQTAAVTVPIALAQATASPLRDIAAGARLAPDIGAQPLGAMNVSLGREGMARGAAIQRAKIQHAKIQRTKSASVSDALAVHPVTAANDSRIHDTKGSVPMPTWHR
jgi:hypothetical protein